MNDLQRQDLLHQMLNSEDSIQQGSAAYDLASSGDVKSIEMLLSNLDKLDAGSRGNAMDMVADGLLAEDTQSLEPLLTCLQNSPASVAGKSSAYILGSIAYKQGKERDSAILPGLLQALDKNLGTGISAAASCIHAIRECARTGPIPTAESAMKSVLADADRSQPQFNTWYLTLALEVLAINHSKSDQDFRAELQNQLQLLPPSSKAFQELQAWLLEV
jgi:hypothetical protein